MATARKKIKIVLALIHRKDERYEYIHPQLLKLNNFLSKSFQVTLMEYSEQPEVVPHTLFMGLRRKYWLWILNREWIRYRNMIPRNIFLDALVLVRRLAITTLQKKKELARCATDSYVTDKHIRAWGDFLESGSDFLICFEDDAVFKKDSAQRLEKVLKNISSDKDKRVYLDFAGGCTSDELKVKKLELKKVADRVFYKKPVTNTGCSYLVSRGSVKNFFYYLLRNPELRYISVDWLLNKLFITSAKSKYICYHMNPTIFDHGSQVGSYKSWL